MQNKILVLLLFVFSVCVGQERVAFFGRVVADNFVVGDVFVINKASGLETKTDANGNFTIAARVGDVLIVYAAKIEQRQFTLSKKSLDDVPCVFSVNYKANEMDELVINKYGAINSESLGLVPKGQKQYTQQEKKLYGALGNKPLWKHSLGLLVGSMPLDPFINAISGRTRRIKNDVANEKKQLAIQKINILFTEDEIVSRLKVPKGYEKGFVFYAAEDEAVLAALNTKTEAEQRFILTALAEKYTNTITNE